jgi:DinB superfamily
MMGPLDQTAPAWCRRLVSELDDSDRRATALAKGLTPERLNWKPRPDVWSVGQCLQHLCVGNELYVPAMAEALSGKRQAVVQEITPGPFGRWFIRNYIEPSPATKRARAPRKIAPSADVEADVLARFLRSNDAIRALMDRARNYDVNRIRFKNPFVPLPLFTVGTGFEILSKHEQRHLLQGERIRALPEFPIA